MLHAIEEFDKASYDLIQKLADKFDLDLDSSHPFSKLQSQANKLRQGDLDGDFTYRFHGSHVCFKSEKSSLVIDVMVTEKKEFGTFTYSNLKYYIETSSHEEILKSLDTFYKFEQMVLNLKKKGYIRGRTSFGCMYFHL